MGETTLNVTVVEANDLMSKVSMIARSMDVKPFVADLYCLKSNTPTGRNHLNAGAWT
jgi:hypothetical protein